MSAAQLAATIAAIWFTLALAVVGMWNAAKWWVRRRSFAAYLVDLERERQGWT